MFERYDLDLSEKPDHKHYLNCLARKNSIQEKCRVIYGYTLIAGIILFLLTLIKTRLSVISWIPMLLGDADELLPFVVQEAIVVFLVALAVLNCGKLKCCGVILFVIYVSMTIAGYLNYEYHPADLFTFLIGLLGTACTRHSITDYTDWRKLVNTEGFPHFSLNVTKADEHHEHEPQYTSAGASYNTEPDEQSSQMEFAEFDAQLDMPEMPSLAQMNAYRDMPVTDEEFVQEGEKYCCISESPIKTL